MSKDNLTEGLLEKKTLELENESFIIDNIPMSQSRKMRESK
jgi:hypothetical protein